MVTVEPVTDTTALAVSASVVAVTVISREVGSPAASSVAVATPFESVTDCVTVRPPESAAKVTRAPARNWLFASRTYAVSVAWLLSSEKMLELSDTRTIVDAALTPPLPLLLEVELLPPTNDLSPPQAARASVTKASIKPLILRICFT